MIHHHLRVCPLYSGFLSPKTKFRHLTPSLVSSSVSPWFVMLHLSISLWVFPIFAFPLVPIQKYSVAVHFLAFSLHIQTIIAIFLQLLLKWGMIKLYKVIKKEGFYLI
jgi:hypothetical protein